MLFLWSYLYLQFRFWVYGVCVCVCVCVCVFYCFLAFLQLQLYSGVPVDSVAVPGDLGGCGLGRSPKDSGVPWLLGTRRGGGGEILGTHGVMGFTFRRRLYENTLM